MANSSQGDVSTTGQVGRPSSTSPHQLENAAFELFDRDGFDDTTVEEIARAAGVSRRTFFRYFDSKNDVVWGNFTGELDRMRAQFSASPEKQPLMAAIRDIVVEFNRVTPSEAVRHRKRLELILRVPALQAHSTLRFADWRTVVAHFAAHRLELPEDALLPQAIAHASLGTALASYEQWLAHPELDLCEILGTAMTHLEHGFTLE